MNAELTFLQFLQSLHSPMLDGSMCFITRLGDSGILWVTLTALLLVFLLPLTAYVQGQVLLPLLIPVIWLGNFIFVLLVRHFKGSRKLFLCVPPLAKACVMLLAAWVVVSFLALPNPALRKTIMFAMSVPQLLTAVAGILLAKQVQKRLRQFN